MLPSQIVELRFYHFPFPRFIAISTIMGRYSMVSITVLRGGPFKRALIESGFFITKESAWRPWEESTLDSDRFGLRSLADTP